MNICGMTEERGVYSIISRATSTNCVSSLSAYYEQNDQDPISLKDPFRLWAIGIFVITSCLITFTGIFLRRWHGQRLALHANLVDPSEAISKSQINQCFPSLTMTTCDEPMCTMCLATVDAEQEYRKLQCNHCFHTDCIDSWWLYTPRVVLECPLCKRVQNLHNPPEASTRPEPEAVGNITLPCPGVEQ